ncbi:radical SAM protein [Candidatus Woesearchaeota archaeon]|nr:radical SAM protein [Candidatus Woesearchaeota archaeon]
MSLGKIRSYFKRRKRNQSGDTYGIILYVTNRCNMKCSHCFYSAELNQPTNEISLDEVRLLAQSFKGRCTAVALTGGEPTMRQELKEIIKILHEHGVEEFEINSNGAFQERLLDLIAFVKEDLKSQISVMISIDGFGKVHDTIRKIPRAYSRAIDTAKKIKARGDVPVYFNTTIMKENYKKLYNMARISEDLGINHNFEIIRSVAQSALPAAWMNGGFAPKEKDELLPKELFPVIREQLLKIYRMRAAKNSAQLLSLAASYTILDMKLETLELNKWVAPCIAGKKNHVIYPDGKVALCEFLKPSGNLRDSNFDFEKIKNNDISQKYQKFIPKCFCIHGCFIDYENAPDFPRRVAINSAKIYVKKKVQPFVSEPGEDGDLYKIERFTATTQ